MFKILLFIALGFMIIFYPQFLLFIFTNLHHFIKWFFIDLYYYFKHKEYNRCKEFGMIRLNCATDNQVFGCGKTLMLVIRARYIYKKYNNKLVWDFDLDQFVVQKIHIISNVELFDVPYIKWSGVNQLIDIDKMGFGSQDITLYLLDESGAIFNSRNFRDNISSDFLTRLLQSRKNKCALYMTSQRFQFTDKILRETCNMVYFCKKKWRIVKTVAYSAYDVEHCLSIDLIKPKEISYRFIFDSDYHSYNSYQLVEDLRKEYNPNDMLDTSEILNTYGDRVVDLNTVNLNRKGRRLLSK